MAKYTICCEDILTGDLFEILEVECDKYNRWAYGITVRSLIEQLLLFDTRRSVAKVYKSSINDIMNERLCIPVFEVRCVCYAEATRLFAQILVNDDIVRIIEDVKSMRVTGCRNL